MYWAAQHSFSHVRFHGRLSRTGINLFLATWQQS